MRIFHTLAGLQTYLQTEARGQKIGLVPTMGALHDGHASLIKRAIAETDWVIVSIFVNPLQFGPQEDLEQYPRTFEADCALAETLGVKAVFAPTAATLGLGELNQQTLVVPPVALTQGLCGAHRPGHFQGVATIVTKLFTGICPDVAYFGEKDAQQLAIVRQLVRDLQLTVEIRACPTVREVSGLALSSRNQYLTPAQREDAAVLYRSLQAAQTLYHQGERTVTALHHRALEILATVPSITLQYLAWVDPHTLEPLTTLTEGQPILGAIAAYGGSTRLIDNLLLNPPLPIIAIDGPAGAGKSTVTRQVADRLGLTYLDTGALYRGLAWLVQQQGIDQTDLAGVADCVAQATIELIPRPAPQLTGVIVNGQDVSDTIRTPAITQIVSAIAAQKAVRDKLLAIQRDYGVRGGLVAEGRDMGTQVFPNALVKIFLTASVTERARRRLKDFQAQGQAEMTLAQLEADIAQRDHQDSTRAIAPLKQAPDAVEILTDGLTVEEVIEQIVDLYRQRKP